MHDTSDRDAEEQRLRAESVSNPDHEFDGVLATEDGQAVHFTGGEEAHARDQRLRAESIADQDNQFDGTLVSEHGDVHDFVGGQELAKPPGFTNYKDDESFDLEDEIDGALAEGRSSRSSSIDEHDAPAVAPAANAVTPPASNGVAAPASNGVAPAAAGAVAPPAPAQGVPSPAAQDAGLPDEGANDAYWKNAAQQMPAAVAQANNQLMAGMTDDQRSKYQQYLSGEPQRGFFARMADRLSAAWDSVKSVVSRLRGGSDVQTPPAQAVVPAAVAPPAHDAGEGPSRGVEGPSHAVDAQSHAPDAPAHAAPAAQAQDHDASDGTYFDLDTDDHDAPHAAAADVAHAGPGVSAPGADDAPHHFTNDDDRARARAVAHEITLEHQQHEVREHDKGEGIELTD
jgi:hypothetical protein